MRQILLILALTSWTTAQESQPMIELQTQGDVAQLVEGARDEILLAAPGIYSHALAEALREAIVVRGVDAYLLVSPNKAEDRAAYVISLQLAGARVRLAEVTESYLVLDREQVLSGSTLAMSEATSVSEAIAHSSDSGEVARAVTSFYNSFQTASVYIPTLPKIRREP